MHLAGRERPSGRAGAAGAPGGEVILIPKQLRAEWTDVMALDPELSATALKVACVIGHHLNKRAGTTYVSQQRIAEITRYASSTVRRAIAELEERGYLIVQRNDLGGRKSDGRRVCGGRGVANTYAPAMDGGQVAATNAGRRLVERAQALLDQSAPQDAGDDAGKVPIHEHLSPSTGADTRAPFSSERCRSDGGKVPTGEHPTLTDPSDRNPTRGRAGAREAAPVHPLGAAAGELLRQFGPAIWRSWFDDLTIEEVLLSNGGELVIGAASEFMRDWVGNHYAEAIRLAFNRVMPPVGQVARIVVKVRP